MANQTQLINGKLAVIGGVQSMTPEGIGYGPGAGGAVTQVPLKVAGVTLNTACGKITMSSTALAANTSVTFSLVSSVIEANDLVLVNIVGGATENSYMVGVNQVVANSCRITLYNFTAGSLAEAVVLSFAVIKGAVN